MVESPAGIVKIREIFAIGSSAFERVPDLVRGGQPLFEVFRAFKIALLKGGAEDVP